MKYADLENEDEVFCQGSMLTPNPWSMAYVILFRAQLSEELSNNIEAPLAEACITSFG